ncbi:MAG: nickel pincer cofactor biosynthesis protein LarB [bacterium]|nr:nickel pincer cofactor biosynthesis protein LarB [bacterium]MDT8396022.1 nickel pincer cofactor biosynthesis protein LarB [bacterium]
MDRKQLLDILEQIASGRMKPDEGLSVLADFPSAIMEYAHLDTHRRVRRGVPETVFGQGKTPEQIVGIVGRLSASGDPVLVTRVSETAAAAVLDRWPEADHDPVSRTLHLGMLPHTGGRRVMVMAAGTSDLPVAEEAARTAVFLGMEVRRGYDVGIAGLHRLAAHRDEMAEAGVIIVVAGMEGALPGVVAGLVRVPVIGVPTSIGYGASLAGFTPLLTMLSSCACGLTVVNIDNGYSAAVAAYLILGNAQEEDPSTGSGAPRGAR